MTICILNEIQFLCPVAAATTCGITLWAFSNNHLFGTAYKDFLIAMDKVRSWRIDPTKHFQSEVHNLMVVIERATETNDNSMPDKNLLAILYEEISKDPREALRITALNCQEQQVPLEEDLTRLLASAGAAPINRTVKIYSMESKTVTPICSRIPLVISVNTDILKILTLHQETIKKLTTITVPIKRNSHPKCQIKNLHLITIIVFLGFHEANHLMDKLQHTQQCKLEH